MNLLAGLRNDFTSVDQPVGLNSDKGAVQATSDGGNVTDVTFVHFLTTTLLKWQLLWCEHMQMNMTRTQKATFLTERMKILLQSRFLVPGGQFAPIFAWISTLTLYIPNNLTEK